MTTVITGWNRKLGNRIFGICDFRFVQNPPFILWISLPFVISWFLTTKQWEEEEQSELPFDGNGLFFERMAATFYTGTVTKIQPPAMQFSFSRPNIGFLAAHKFPSIDSRCVGLKSI